MNSLAEPTSPQRVPFLFALLKNLLFVQNIASFVLSRVPPVIEHNLGKYQALRKAFYLTALEQLQGDYLEFGVFTGSSFIFAMNMNLRLKAMGRTTTRFFGYDSFAGFGPVGAGEEHPFYSDSNFAVNEAKVVRNIKRRSSGQHFELIKGYFEATLAGKTAKDVGVAKTRVALIDCDLKNASRLALDYLKPTLQEGSVLIMDDFFSYRGVSDLGTAGAFHEFCAANPNIEFRRVFDYGFGGVGYIVSRFFND